MKSSNFSKFHSRGASREFSWKFTLWITFQPFDRFSQNVYLSIQLNKRNITKTSKFLQFHSRGEPGIFRQTTSNMHFSTAHSTASTLRRLFQLDNFHRKVATSSLLLSSYRLRKTAKINGKKLLSLKPVVSTRRSYKRVGLTKRQKFFQGLAMYDHEVWMSLQTRAKIFWTHFLHLHVSDIRQWRMTVYSMEIRWQHCQATSFMSDLDDVNFPVIVAKCISPLGVTWTVSGWFNSKMITQK
jgi:hypothetical protein